MSNTVAGARVLPSQPVAHKLPPTELGHAADGRPRSVTCRARVGGMSPEGARD